MHRPAIEPRKTYHPGCRHSSECGRPYARARCLRAPGRSGVVTDPGTCRRFLYGNREVPRPTELLGLVEVTRQGGHGIVAFCDLAPLPAFALRLLSPNDRPRLGAGEVQLRRHPTAR